MPRRTAVLLLVGVACGSPTAASTTTTIQPMVTTTTTTTTTAVSCVDFVTTTTEALSEVVRVLAEFENMGFRMRVAASTGGGDDVADEIVLLAATIRGVTRDLSKLDTPEKMGNTHDLLMDALNKLDGGLDRVAAGVRQGRADLIESGDSDIAAGTALTAAARAALPDDC